VEVLTIRMRRSDGKEGRLRSAKTGAYERQTEFPGGKEPVFIDEEGGVRRKPH
jgi:hypothetical protein